MKKQNDEINLKDLVGVFIPKLWIILIVSVIVSLLLGAYAMFFKSDTYTSKATLMINKSNSTSISASDIDTSVRLIELLSEVVTSGEFLSDVEAAVTENSNQNITVKVAELKGAVSVRKRAETSMFDIVVTTASPERSYAIANAVRDVLTGNTWREDLQSFNNIDMITMESPVIAGSANSKGVVTNLLIGFLVGAVISAVVVYIMSMFDVVIHDRKKIEDNFDIPILGVIPSYDIDEVKANEAVKEARANEA